jgi:hypothetical protein
MEALRTALRKALSDDKGKLLAIKRAAEQTGGVTEQVLGREVTVILFEKINARSLTISEFLEANLGSHDIAAYDSIAADFANTTGLMFCAPRHSAKRIRDMIRLRGAGGDYEGELDGCNGWETAEELAIVYADFKPNPNIQGRGSRYRAALEALRQAGK